MRILSVKQIQPIQVKAGYFLYPLSSSTKIILDKKNPSNKKEHQLIYQQGATYGTVGDCCTYLTNEDLLHLEEKGMIVINKTK